MSLKQTYETEVVHDDWEAVYRGNPLQDRLNSRTMDRVLAAANVLSSSFFLDAGCGVGYHSLAIANRGYRGVGIDISEKILETARHNASAAGLESRLSFRCEELEQLTFDDATFDAIHCRGVLMHIPQWERALAELCRVLKPGGAMILMEANQSSVEARLVRFLRLVRRPKSRIVKTPAGEEFWSEVNGNPFVVRIADLKYLAARLGDHGVRVEQQFATEFWDTFRFPSGLVRNSAIRFNHFWFRLGLPACLSMGNVMIGRKALASSGA